MTCRRCGKAAPEGTRASTAAWCVDCQKATLAPPERFLGYPRVEVETRGNAKWEYRIPFPGQTAIWRTIHVKVHKPGINYRVVDQEHPERPRYTDEARLNECLQELAEAICIEARAKLVTARVDYQRAEKDYEVAQQLVDLLLPGNVVKAEVPGFWDRLNGVESDHGTPAASEMATGQDRRE